MPTTELLQAQLTDAMRNKDEVKKRTFRMILAAIKLAEVEKRAKLDEAGVLTVLQREVKTRQESIAEAEKAGRPDLIADTQAELEVIRALLPAAMAPAELEAIVRKAIQDAGASGPADMGKVMKLVTPQTAGRADNKEVSALVRSLLAG